MRNPSISSSVKVSVKEHALAMLAQDKIDTGQIRVAQGPTNTCP